MNKHWREQLQADIDDTRRLRETSLVRVGDHITSTKPCLEGAGRARLSHYKGLSLDNLLKGVPYANK